MRRKLQFQQQRDGQTRTNLGTTGNAFASYLLGTVDSADRVGSQEEKLRNRDFSPYIQDDIKLRPNLTINIGVRWDIMVPFTAIGNNIVFLNPATPNPGRGWTTGRRHRVRQLRGLRRIRSRQHPVGSPQSPGRILVRLQQQDRLARWLLAELYGWRRVRIWHQQSGRELRQPADRIVPSQFDGEHHARFRLWDSNILPIPAQTPFSPTLGIGQQINAFSPTDGLRAVRNRLEHRHPARIAPQYAVIGALHRKPGQLPAGPVEPSESDESGVSQSRQHTWTAG